MNKTCPLPSMGKEKLIECTDTCTFYDRTLNCALKSPEKLIQIMEEEITRLDSLLGTLNGFKEDFSYCKELKSALAGLEDNISELRGIASRLENLEYR